MPSKKIPINEKVMETIRKISSQSNKDDQNPIAVDEFNLFFFSEYVNMLHTFCSLETVRRKRLSNDNDVREAARLYEKAYR